MAGWLESMIEWLDVPPKESLLAPEWRSHMGEYVPEQTSFLFEVSTPLGFSVRTTADYWALIATKHPEIHARQAEVEACLSGPDQIRQSKQDNTVYLFYRLVQPYHVCVVVKRLNDTGFVITSYLTDRIKEGEKIWPTSA
jgi:hypothetical protein